MTATQKSLPFLYVLLMMALTMLGACSMTSPTDVTTSKIQIDTDVREYVTSAEGLSEAELLTLADDYRRRGEGGIGILVSYDHRAKNSQTMLRLAHRQGEVIRDTLAKQRIGQSIVRVMPAVHDAPGTIKLFYRVASSFAPPECDRRMPGAGETPMDIDPDYRFSCEIKRMMAAQVARPQDLEGRSGSGDMPSQRLSVPADRYDSGEPINDTEVDIATGVAE